MVNSFTLTYICNVQRIFPFLSGWERRELLLRSKNEFVNVRFVRRTVEILWCKSTSSPPRRQRNTIRRENGKLRDKSERWKSNSFRRARVKNARLCNRIPDLDDYRAFKAFMVAAIANRIYEVLTTIGIWNSVSSRSFSSLQENFCNVPICNSNPVKFLMYRTLVQRGLRGTMEFENFVERFAYFRWNFHVELKSRRLNFLI